ncbi:MAG: hypothetical protein K0Q92_3178 [Steroidobacteraceae bacterium]|nr:hypothetical protein [Steroidobacteraceae bacterium]
MAHNKNNNKNNTKKSYSAPALEKGMDIIELLADAESGLTISEISERLRRRMSELFRIIVVMERRGWLRKDPENSRYSVSYHVLLLAHRGTPAQTLSAAAAPVMQELSARTDQSCHLVIRSGSQCLVIFRQENQKRYANLSVRMGAVLNLVTSNSGRVLLAHLEGETRDAVLRTLPRLKSSRARFETELARIRERGCSPCPIYTSSTARCPRRWTGPAGLPNKPPAGSRTPWGGRADRRTVRLIFRGTAATRNP